MLCDSNAFCVAGASSALTKTPRNVIIEKGDDVYMECSTDAFTGSNTITWEHDGPDVTRLTCASIDSSRFNVSRSTTNDCFLVGYANSISGNQGPYHCTDGSGIKAEAVAILIGSFLVVFHETLKSQKDFASKTFWSYCFSLLFPRNKKAMICFRFVCLYIFW